MLTVVILDDKLVKVAPILERFGDFAALLGSPEDETALKRLRNQKQRDGRWAANIGLSNLRN